MRIKETSLANGIYAMRKKQLEVARAIAGFNNGYMYVENRRDWYMVNVLFPQMVMEEKTCGG